jgi:hypothetical protein
MNLAMIGISVTRSRVRVLDAVLNAIDRPLVSWVSIDRDATLVHP